MRALLAALTLTCLVPSTPLTPSPPSVTPSGVEGQPPSATPEPQRPPFPGIVFEPPPDWQSLARPSLGTTILGTWLPPDPGLTGTSLTLASIPYSGSVDALVAENIHKFQDDGAAFELVGKPHRLLRCRTTAAVELTLASTKLRFPEQQRQTYIVALGNAYVASYVYRPASEIPSATAAATAALDSLCRAAPAARPSSGP